MRTNLTQTSIFSLAGLILTTAGIFFLGTSFAIAQNSVKGTNVTEVRFGNPGDRAPGVFRQIDGKRWYRIDPDRYYSRRFDETARGEWTVYLSEATGKSTVTLNLWSKEVTQTTGGKTVVLGKVLAAEGEPARRVSYAIQYEPDGRFLRAADDGNMILSGQNPINDDYEQFVLERQTDGSYCIRVKADGRYLRQYDERMFVSTRYRSDDPCPGYMLEPQSAGSYRIEVRSEERFAGDSAFVLFSNGYQPVSGHAALRQGRRYGNELTDSNDVEISFINRTNLPTTIYWVNYGREIFLRTLGNGESFRQPTNVYQRWRVRQNGRLLGTYTATSEYYQNVEITTRKVDAGLIRGPREAKRICGTKAKQIGKLWTGTWTTTFPQGASVCELYVLQPGQFSRVN